MQFSVEEGLGHCTAKLHICLDADPSKAIRLHSQYFGLLEKFRVNLIVVAVDSSSPEHVFAHGSSAESLVTSVISTRILGDVHRYVKTVFV